MIEEELQMLKCKVGFFLFTIFYGMEVLMGVSRNASISAWTLLCDIKNETNDATLTKKKSTRGMEQQVEICS